MPVPAITLTENLDSWWTSTWPNYRPGVIDAVFLKKYPLFYWLSQKKHIQYISSGSDIRYPIEVDINPTVAEIGRVGTVSLADVDPFTTVIYPWATLAGNLNRYRDDDLHNVGKAAQFKLADAKRRNLIKSMQKRFEELFFRARGSRPADGFYSLLDLVDVIPTGARTIGNVAQADHSWWQNETMTATGAATPNGRVDMQALIYDLEDVESTPDIGVCHKDFYAAYENTLLEMHMITNKTLADASFRNLVYMDVPLVKSPSCPQTSLFFLNTEFLYLVIHRAMNFEMTQWKEVMNQPFNRSAQIVVHGQLLATNRRAQGVLHTITF